MQQLILLLHVLIALALISLVLIQHGKGADVGATFGSGAANTMFGSVGPASFLMKLTGVLAAIFFATSIVLVYLSSKQQATEPMQFNQPVNTAPSTAPPSAEDSFKPSELSSPVSQKSSDS